MARHPGHDVAFGDPEERGWAHGHHGVPEILPATGPAPVGHGDQQLGESYRGFPKIGIPLDIILILMRFPL